MIAGTITGNMRVNKQDGSENDRRSSRAMRSGPYDVTQMQDWKKRDMVLSLGNCALLAASLMTLVHVLAMQAVTIVYAHPRQFQAEAWQ